LEQEPDQEVRAALDQALIQLENRPAPPLEIQLMGAFSVRRAGLLLAEEVWPRPIVKKLFCYFVLHRGRPLARERILDELWPESDPQTGTTTFRRVHSWLRGVLEPHLRAKARSRYFLVEGDVYTFDPDDRAKVDVEGFTQQVRSVLNVAHRHDIPPLDAAFLASLEQWQPLLPFFAYEEWLIEARERLHTLYVEGALYVANAYLIRKELANAILWAERTVSQAPWLEEGYQILMRAHAYQGERSLALKAYLRAEEALTRELAADPSPLTQWLAARLRRGEEL
jgi:DNA-binding SARP family transcriptional activator